LRVHCHQIGVGDVARHLHQFRPPASFLRHGAENSRIFLFIITADDERHAGAVLERGKPGVRVNHQ
jgi:hypothetical protein